jgi:hypothetical protein
MFDVALHTGIDHPNVLWIVVPALLSFVAGIGLGRLTRGEAERADEPTPERE